MNNISSEKITITPLKKNDHQAWDQLVHSHPEGTFFHLAGWQNVLTKSFSHQEYYRLAWQENQVVGILPLIRQKSLLFGDALISTPFCVTGGVIAINDTIKNQLEQEAVALAEKLRVDYLEMRLEKPRNDHWLRKDLYYGFCKTMEKDAKANLMAIPRKQRAEVRKAQRKGLTWQIDDTTDRCYDLYAQSVRNLGTPVFSRSYFHQLKETFGENCEPLIITLDNEPISAVLSFYYKDQVLPYYGGGGIAARRTGANAYMYWALMDQALSRGAIQFDFGRSKKGTGAYNFKRFFGFTPKPLAYEYHLVQAQEMPDVSPNNPKYKLFINLWKRLPVGLSKIAGPWLAKNLG
ncbi:FemAB family XrtA/PEP-CTERM system-associated protein [Magnetococcales bacterium HHB-1]